MRLFVDAVLQLGQGDPQCWPTVQRATGLPAPSGLVAPHARATHTDPPLAQLVFRSGSQMVPPADSSFCTQPPEKFASPLCVLWHACSVEQQVVRVEPVMPHSLFVPLLPSLPVGDSP